MFSRGGRRASARCAAFASLFLSAFGGTGCAPPVGPAPGAPPKNAKADAEEGPRGETAVGMKVFRKEEAAARDYAKKGAAPTDRIPFPAEVEAVVGEDLWLGRGWVKRTEVRDVDQAAAWADERIRLAPQDPFGYERRAAVRLSQGDAGGAREDAAEALRLDPKRASALVLRGASREANQDLAGAAEDFSAAVALDPKHAEAFHLRGLVRQAQGDAAGAMEDFDAAIQADPGFGAALRSRGAARHAAGKLKLAAEDFSAAAKADPYDAKAYLGRAYVRIDQEDYVSVLADGVRFTKIDPENPAGKHLLGLAWRKRGRPDKALLEFTNAIELDAFAPQYRHDRGEVFQELGQYDLAVKDFAAAIRMRPEYAPGYLARGLAHRKNGDFEKAVQDYDEALRRDPKFALAACSRGHVRRLLGKPAEALADYELALHLDARCAEACNGRGLLRMDAGDYVAAKLDFDRAVACDSGRASSWMNRAWLLATAPDEKFRNGKAAVADAEEACKLDGWATGRMVEVLAAACAEAGDFDRAVEYLKQANSLFPTEAERAQRREWLAGFRDRRAVRLLPPKPETGAAQP